MDFLAVSCAGEDAPGQLIRARLQFSWSNQARILTWWMWSPPREISAIAVTWHRRSMPRAVPCVLSCHVQTKMTPIMPINIRSAGAPRCRSFAATRTLLGDSQKGRRRSRTMRTARLSKSKPWPLWLEWRRIKKQLFFPPLAWHEVLPLC